MTVTLTSPVLGKAVGATHTGPEEADLLAGGYAKQTNYTGPGVANTGPSDTTPANDMQLPANREAAPERTPEGSVDPGPRDSAMGFSDPKEPTYDFDAGGLNLEAPTVTELLPADGPLAAGQKVSVLGQNLKRSTAVTFGGVAATSVVVKDDGRLDCVAPAHAAGAVTVVVTNPNGTGTKAAAYTYKA